MIDSMSPLAQLAFIFLLFLAILWFLLPFAIFGTKDKLQEIIDQTIINTQAIEKLNASIDKNMQP